MQRNGRSTESVPSPFPVIFTCIGNSIAKLVSAQGVGTCAETSMRVWRIENSGRKHLHFHLDDPNLDAKKLQ